MEVTLVLVKKAQFWRLVEPQLTVFEMSRRNASTNVQITTKGFVCSDLDECSDKTHHCSAIVKSAQCFNYFGGYTCNCPLGKRLTIDVLNCNPTTVIGL